MLALTHTTHIFLSNLIHHTGLSILNKSEENKIQISFSVFRIGTRGNANISKNADVLIQIHLYFRCWILRKFKDKGFNWKKFSILFSTQVFLLFFNQPVYKTVKKLYKSIRVDPFQQEIHVLYNVEIFHIGKKRDILGPANIIFCRKF